MQQALAAQTEWTRAVLLPAPASYLACVCLLLHFTLLVPTNQASGLAHLLGHINPEGRDGGECESSRMRQEQGVVSRLILKAHLTVGIGCRLVLVEFTFPA